ncbi:hypothetical protein HIM_02746 [Hirsutella minnesotensis 3608]|nr:hypothetical protein HIM_02746 [Hirsutella minnesotensis 3608]
MTESRDTTEPVPYLSSSARPSAGASHGVPSSSVRSRHRRPVASTGENDCDSLRHRDNTSKSRLPYNYRDSSSPRRSASTARRDTGTGPGSGTLGQFLGESWSQGWSSVQGLASLVLSGGDDDPQRTTTSLQSRSPARGRSQPRPQDRRNSGGRSRTNSNTWGPTPPVRKSAIDDLAAGSVAEREAALKAARTASILESHDGVNGGLDITGRHKRRSSVEVTPADPQPENCLVYIHHVQSDDTYAGLILRYKCREDVFRKANGLWSRDSIQTRKWLAFPVDACDIRGRPCEAPSWQNSHETDLLAPTPNANDDPLSSEWSGQKGFFDRTPDGGTAERKLVPGEGEPWTHVRWVQIDSFHQPIQIARVSKQTLGYFPPRRKKSIRTASSLSTPRHSLELSMTPAELAPLSSTPRRQSLLGNRIQTTGSLMPPSSHTTSDADDPRPAWMRRPGGVGSMNRNISAPGPEGDYFNWWTRKHLPGLNIESLPSMSIMGSESARFGFTSESSGIVESPFEDGRDVKSVSRQGTGLDRAAAAVEGWLRGALTKRPNAPMLGTLGRPTGSSTVRNESDLIELADTGSEDGRVSANIASSASISSMPVVSGRDEGDGAVNRRPQSLALNDTRSRHKAD